MSSKRFLIAASLTAGLSMCLLALGSCARKDFGTLKQKTRATEQQQIYTDLYAPIRAGHALLSEVLPQADAEIFIFSLDRSGATRVKKTLQQSDLWKENQALFFRVPALEDEKDRWYYYQARDMNIVELNTAPQMQTDIDDNYNDSNYNDSNHSASDSDSGSSQGCDSAQRTDNAFTIVRSVAVSHKPTFTQNELDVYSFTFSLNKRQQLHSKSHQRLTSHEGNNILPVLIPGSNRVAYSSRDDNGFSRVMTVSLDGGDSSALIPKTTALSTVQSSHPRILSDGSLGISANPDGYFRTYSYDFSSSSLSVSSLRPRGSHNGDLILSNLDGSQTPILLNYPNHFDLESILTLVHAQNSSINRYRALLAAELIQTRRSKLSVLPSLQFGVYYTPYAQTHNGASSSGDFLAAGIARGIFGIVQDVFAIPRKLAMSESQLMRSEIVRDSLLDEINQRQAEAAELFFQAQLYQQLIDIDHVLLEIVVREEERQQQRQLRGQALSAEIMGQQGNVLAVRKRLDDHQRHLELTLNELKFMCALPMHKDIHLDTGIFHFEKDDIENYETLKRMAVLNHPKIQAARINLHKAFFDQKTGGGRSPGLSIGAQGGTSYDITNARSPVDEYITLSMNAEIPLGFRKDKRLATSYWQEINSSLAFEQERQSERILRKLQSNYQNFHNSRNAYEVQQQHLSHALEDIRLARLYKRYPLVTTAYRKHNPSMAQAREMYYQTLSESLRQHASLAKHFIRMWRDMGLASHLPQRLQAVTHQQLQAQRFSTWIWNSSQLLAGDSSINECIRVARTHHVKRLYVYLENDDSVLNDPLLSERLTMLINKGASAHIQVWALVGHSRSTDVRTQSQIHNSARSIERYNKRFHALEPRIAGMKIHLKQAASNELIEQKHYRNILEQTRALLPNDVPLWIDVPLCAFTPENSDHIRELLDLVNGVTVFDPNGNNQQIFLQSDTVLELSPATVEFALQQNPESDGTELNNIIRQLNKTQLHKHNFAGVALLDWTRILAADEPTHNPSKDNPSTKNHK